VSEQPDFWPASAPTTKAEARRLRTVRLRSILLVLGAFEALGAYQAREVAKLLDRDAELDVEDVLIAVHRTKEGAATIKDWLKAERLLP
jgi:hypothetical protein